MRTLGARIAVAFCVLSVALPMLAQGPGTQPAQKSLQLDPKNDNARHELEALKK